MKKFYLLIILQVILVSTIYSQKDTALFNHSLLINVNDLFIERLLATYSKPINARDKLEFTLGYRYSGIKKVGAGSIFFIKDAFWYYNDATLRIGIKRYYNKDMFLGFSGSFDYQFFNKIRFNQFVDEEGDLYDQDWVISRRKYQIGSMLKIGIVHIGAKKKFIMENYFGIGLSYQIRKETVNERYFWYGGPSMTPIKSTTNGFIPTIHFGISIGVFN